MPKFIIVLIGFLTILPFLLSSQEQEERVQEDVDIQEQSKVEKKEIPELISQVNVTKFTPIININGSSISFSLDTDLPDNAEIMISISRLYTEKDNDNKYPISYYLTKKTVDEIREPLSITLDHGNWERELNERKALFMTIGEPFDVDQISNEVEVSFTLPANQKNPAFGKNNENLIGSIVEHDGSRRIINIEEFFDIPLSDQSKLTLNKKSYNLNALHLEDGVQYQNDKDLVFYTNYVLGDMLQTSVSKKTLPANSFFEVLNKKMEGDVAWYEIVLSDNLGVTSHKGWTNSQHLKWQRLSVQEKSPLNNTLSSTDRTKNFEEILSAWSPLKIEEGEGIFHVHLPQSTITNTIYKSVLQYGVCLALNYEKTALSGIDEIVLTNKNQTSGYIFKGGQSECEAINAGDTSTIKNNMTTCINDCLE